MPAFSSLGQHAALEAVQATLREGEHLFAFLDDVAQEFQLELQREFGGTAGVDFRSKVRAAVFQPKTTQG